MCTVDSVQCSVGVLKEPDRPGQICASQWGINSKIREEKRKEADFLGFKHLAPALSGWRQMKNLRKPL